MSTPPSLQIEKLMAILMAEGIGLHPSELHGTIVGIISGGVEQTTEAWQPLLIELSNNNEPFPPSVQSQLNELYQDTLNRLDDFDFGFTLLLPEEEEPLNVRVDALFLWVNNFLSALAIAQPKLNDSSERIQQYIEVMSNIFSDGAEVGDDEDSESAFFELLDFVREAAMNCYSEFAPEVMVDDSTNCNTLH
ncbi:YecA family protein [Parashewanella spongiae]|uniref:YecA family protein n=1 Tax=Parashewanella spongiae TaxID=342950 RepID=A0A3A6TZF3_9GAMM|nr:UPF0149 family protein [Parashewanella spongiae]MCL1079771.1 UPF0149 family protein [Parashewanella spongiae]RJY06909.1 YecA family protein [Parashewanella spongiae]